MGTQTARPAPRPLVPGERGERAMTTTPPDQVDRDRIERELDRNLFVEAGAGAGKTTSLVGRIVALVRSGVPIEGVAAITFTEKAAADLRHRLRAALLTAANDSSVPEESARFESALDSLDHAPIGTLHAFARRLLNEFPVAAGLPPGFGVLDELESNLAFEERWEDLLERLLEHPHPAGGALQGGVDLVQLCDFDEFGLDKTFRRVAVGFHENWDLVDARVDTSEPPAWTVDVTRLTTLVEAAGTVEAPPDDKQAELVGDLRRWAAQLRADPTTIERLTVCTQITGACKSAGTK